MKKISCSSYDIIINDWDSLNTFLREGEYANIIIIVDENTKTITVTSRTDATAKGLPIYDLSK